MQGEAAFTRMWQAQMPMLGLPYLGLPALTVSTGLLAERPSVCKSFRRVTARIFA